MATETPVQEKEVPPFRLLPAVDPEGHAEAVMPTSWCFSEEMQDQLLIGKMRDAHILIVVTCQGNERLRLVVPWKEQVRHIPFDMPGPNVVHAMPVWPGGGASVEEMREILLAKYDSGNGYRCTLLKNVSEPYKEDEPRPATWMTSDGSQPVTVIGEPEFHEETEENYYEIEGSATRLPQSQLVFHERTKEVLRKEFDWDKVQCLDAEWTQVIDVKDGHFAKEPPAIVRRLIAFSTPSKSGRPKDSCQVFWRTVGALAAFWPVVLWTTVKMLASAVVVGFLWFLGKRGVNYEAITRPRHHDPSYTWTHLGSSVWWTKKNGDDRWAIFLVLNPPVFVILSIIIGAVKEFLWPGIAVGNQPLPVLTFIAMAAIIVIVTVVLVLLAVGDLVAENRLVQRSVTPVRKLSAPISRGWSTRKAAWEVAQRKRERDTQQREDAERREIVQVLTCGNREAPPSVEEVINPSLELRVRAYKYRHCRPFSRG
jgi:hypothetical protein